VKKDFKFCRAIRECSKGHSFHRLSSGREVSVQAILFLLSIPANNLPKLEGLRIKLERRHNNKNATSRGIVNALNEELTSIPE